MFGQVYFGIFFCFCLGCDVRFLARIFIHLDVQQRDQTRGIQRKKGTANVSGRHFPGTTNEGYRTRVEIVNRVKSADGRRSDLLQLLESLSVIESLSLL